MKPSMVMLWPQILYERFIRGSPNYVTRHTKDYVLIVRCAGVKEGLAEAARAGVVEVRDFDNCAVSSGNSGSAEAHIGGCELKAILITLLSVTMTACVHSPTV